MGENEDQVQHRDLSYFIMDCKIVRRRKSFICRIPMSIRVKNTNWNCPVRFIISIRGKMRNCYGEAGYCSDIHDLSRKYVDLQKRQIR